MSQDAVADATTKKSENRKRQGSTLVRHDDAERQRYEQAAACLGLSSLAEFFRAAGNSVATGQSVTRAVRRSNQEVAALRELLRLAGNMAGNCNQLARAYNTTNDYPAMAELTAIRENLTQLRRELVSALGSGLPG